MQIFGNRVFTIKGGGQNFVIIGGGGIVNHENSWNDILYKCQELTGHVILWGVGDNTHDDDSCSPFDYSKIYLAGVRDKKDQYVNCEYVPCPSCMLPQLAYKYNMIRRIGVIEHTSYPIDEFPYEKKDNSEDINTILQFIGESEIIITNSYHAVYWATLMKRKVLIYDRWSTKFDYLMYEQPIYSGNLEKDLEKCIVYENALQECRNLNIEFAQKIKKMIDASTENEYK